METARSSITLQLPAKDAREAWEKWSSQRVSGASAGTTDIPRDQLPLEQAEVGQIHFNGSNGSTEVAMELRYNPRAVEEAGRGPDFVEKRIEMYLRRFKEEVER